MKRMEDIIQKKILERHNKFEEKPHQQIQSDVVGHFLYGMDEASLKTCFDVSEQLESLKKKDSSFWISLIQKYLLDQPYVNIVGMPSIEYAKELQQKEKDRIQEQREKLGKKKLEELQSYLDKAIMENERPIPPEIILQFKVPDASKIPFIPIKTIRNESIVTKSEDMEKLFEHLGTDTVPFFLQFDHVSSFFVQFRTLINASNLPEKFLPYLEAYLEVMYEVPFFVFFFKKLSSQLNEMVNYYRMRRWFLN